jgi:hypothetical protein
MFYVLRGLGGNIEVVWQNSSAIVTTMTQVIYATINSDALK